MMQRLIWAVVALLAGSVGPGRADDGFAIPSAARAAATGNSLFPRPSPKPTRANRSKAPRQILLFLKRT